MAKQQHDPFRDALFKKLGRPIDEPPEQSAEAAGQMAERKEENNTGAPPQKTIQTEQPETTGKTDSRRMQQSIGFDSTNLIYLKRIALIEGISISDVINRLIEAFVKSQKERINTRFEQLTKDKLL